MNNIISRNKQTTTITPTYLALRNSEWKRETNCRLYYYDYIKHMWTCVEYRTADEQKCFVGKKNRIKTNNFYNGNCVTTE